MSRLGLSRVHFPVTTLGPGKRLGIWFQGCSLKCPGCISADTWSKAKQFIEIEAFVESLDEWIMQADGITISGGEPFDQPQALLTLVRVLKQKTAADILVYTGYSMSQIIDYVAAAAPNIDVLISEPFQYQMAQTLSLRGSDNQIMHLMTPLGEARFKAYNGIRKPEKTLDIMFDDDGLVWMAGIPQRDDMLQLISLLEQQGHNIAFTLNTPKR